MIVKRNRQNNNFQIAYFIAGSCFTPDAAYFALLNQRDDRRRALQHQAVEARRSQAKKLQAQRLVESADPVEQLQGQADLEELHNQCQDSELLAESCREELAFIDLCIERITPLRQYSHMTDNDAAEACQREEFAREFQFRIENFMATSGSIPHTELAVMRQHPDFNNLLLPHINHVTRLLQSPGGAQQLLPVTTKTFDLPALLGMENHHAT
jgi:hypothetical protein